MKQEPLPSCISDFEDYERVVRFLVLDYAVVRDELPSFDLRESYSRGDSLLHAATLWIAELDKDLVAEIETFLETFDNLEGK